MGKLEESQAILKSFGLPPAQQNEMAAYTLLALADLKEGDRWSKCGRRMWRAHDLIQFINGHYDKDYKENTRESFRKNVLHQLEEARIVDRNPDNPKRATNSGKTCYAITAEAQAVIALYGVGDRFMEAVAEFQRSHPALLEVYRAARAACR